MKHTHITDRNVPPGTSRKLLQLKPVPTSYRSEWRGCGRRYKLRPQWRQHRPVARADNSRGAAGRHFPLRLLKFTTRGLPCRVFLCDGPGESGLAERSEHVVLNAGSRCLPPSLKMELWQLVRPLRPRTRPTACSGCTHSFHVVCLINVVRLEDVALTGSPASSIRSSGEGASRSPRPLCEPSH